MECSCGRDNGERGGGGVEESEGVSITFFFSSLFFPRYITISDLNADLQNFRLSLVFPLLPPPFPFYFYFYFIFIFTSFTFCLQNFSSLFLHQLLGYFFSPSFHLPFYIIMIIKGKGRGTFNDNEKKIHV